MPVGFEPTTRFLYLINSQELSTTQPKHSKLLVRFKIWRMARYSKPANLSVHSFPSYSLCHMGHHPIKLEERSAFEAHPLRSQMISNHCRISPDDLRSKITSQDKITKNYNCLLWMKKLPANYQKL